jgi:hypothetical protein
VKLAPIDKAVDCDRSVTDTIVIITTEGQFSVAPPHLCAKAETPVTVRFSPRLPAGTVTMTAKPFIDAPWLKAANPATAPWEDSFTPPAEAKGSTFVYTITAIGWGTIDPMISVRD